MQLLAFKVVVGWLPDEAARSESTAVPLLSYCPTNAMVIGKHHTLGLGRPSSPLSQAQAWCRRPLPASPTQLLRSELLVLPKRVRRVSLHNSCEASYSSWASIVSPTMISKTHVHQWCQQRECCHTSRNYASWLSRTFPSLLGSKTPFRPTSFRRCRLLQWVAERGWKT